ncbi:MAG TPA: MFS transporter [Bacillota bacterium]
MALITQLGFGIVAPALPAYAVSLGVDTAAVGWVVTIYGLARLVTNYPVGVWAERIGRRPLLIGGGLVLALGSALCGLAPSFGWLLVWRFVAGAGAAAVITMAQIILADLSTPANRGRVMSIYMGFFLIGVSTGPVPGGYLADRYGLAAPLFGYAALAALGAMVSALFVPETRPAGQTPARQGAAADGAGSNPPAPGKGQGGKSSPRSLLRQPAFILVSLVTFAQFFTRTGAVFAVIPLKGSQELGLSVAQVGAALSLIGLINVAALYPAGYVADRYGRKPPIVIATVVCGLAMALFAMSRDYRSYLLAAAIWGLGSGVGGPLPAAYAADLASGTSYGTTMGMYRTLADAGYVLGPVVLSSLAAGAGFGVSLGFCALLFGVGGALFAWRAPETRRPPRDLTALG